MSETSPPSNSRRWKWQQWGIVLVVALYAIIALAYSVINPLYEATDELRHYRFVRTIVENRKLPVQGEEPCRSQSHHPPLFYGLGALLTFWIESDTGLCERPEENPFWAYRYWDVGNDNKNQYLHGENESFPWYGDALGAHIVRGLNILIGAAAVFLTWASGKRIWPKREAIALGGAAIVAFNPMFLYMAGAINNDIIAALAGAAVTYTCLTLLCDTKGLNWRWGLIFGTVFGLALLSKLNLAVSLLLIEAVITWKAWKKREWRQWLMVNGLLVLITGVLAGWWFVRNQMLYGEPTGFQQVTELWGFREPGESFGLAVSELPYAFTTLWGRFGFGQIPLPQIIYQGLIIFVSAGLLGAVIGYVRKASKQERAALLFLAVNVVLFFLVLFNYMLVSPAGPNGRFFFPALSALALLLIYGLSQLLLLFADVANRYRDTPQEERFGDIRIETGAGIAVGGGMFLLALIVLFGYLRPAYAKPPSFSDQAEIPNSLKIRFDQLATLRGYSINTNKVQPGGFLDIELFWEVNNQPPGNYLLFVHLIDEDGSIVAQRDTHPGLGNFPASQWRPGDRFIEQIRLQIPETAYAPATAALNIGLYAPESYRLAANGVDGQDFGDAYQIGTIELASEEGQFPNPQSVNFGDDIMLIGYEYGRRDREQGEELLVTLYWQALESVSKDYIAEVRLLDSDKKIWAADDRQPGTRPASTADWHQGLISIDTHRLVIDPTAPAGTYLVEVALLDTEADMRQNIIAPDGHWIDDHLLLAPIQIKP